MVCVFQVLDICLENMDLGSEAACTTAVDLGCGSGRDLVYLAQRLPSHWKVCQHDSSTLQCDNVSFSHACQPCPYPYSTPPTLSSTLCPIKTVQLRQAEWQWPLQHALGSNTCVEMCYCTYSATTGGLHSTTAPQESMEQDVWAESQGVLQTSGGACAYLSCRAAYSAS